MSFARIQNGQVMEILHYDPTGMFHPDLVFVQAPSYVEEGWLFDGELFSPPEMTEEVEIVITLGDAKINRVNVINRAVALAIEGGYISAALGAPHMYDSELEDQVNLIGVLALGVDHPFACVNEQGIRDYRMHTAQQIRQVAADGAARKMQLLQHATMLKYMIQQAETVEVVNSIVWSDPTP